jgi:uncharacterized protein (DUF697 family)
MHDMDSTRAELENGLDALEGTGFEFETNGDGFGGFREAEMTGEAEFGGNGEAAFNEMQEMELAAELLEVTNEQELNQFLGSLIKRVGRAAGQFVRGPVGQALGGVLRQAARTALPIAGAALGNLIAPGVGGAIGGKLAGAAGKAFGLELEGMSNEDREFEVARRYVRFAGASARNALRVPPRVPPHQAARVAATAAARRYAPGLLRAPWLVGGPNVGIAGNGYDNGQQNGGGYGDDGAAGPGYEPPENGVAYGGSSRSGRWFRRGRRIIIVGI